MLYASLAASLFSAFLAMLGKQWLNQYASNDMRGTAIERSQNRQRKHNGIVTWYFNHVMESLPLMLQFALLLLGCALSLYIWGINRTVASVVLGVTLFGIVCYALILVAGTASVSCPYQTPGAQFLRYLWQKTLSHSTFFATRSFVVPHPGDHPGPEQAMDWETTALDFHCISWMLRTSLDRRINQSTLKYLTSVLTLPGFKTTIIADCFNVFVSSVSVTNDNQVIALRGSEQLAENAATCFLSALTHLFIVDPKSNILKDIRQEFNRIFPPTVNLQSLHFHHAITIACGLFDEENYLRCLSWKGVDPSTPENTSLAQSLVKVAWMYCQQPANQRRVPHWILCFPFHSLLQNPNLPVPVIANCLLIVAIDMGCEITEAKIKNTEKRYAYLSD